MAKEQNVNELEDGLENLELSKKPPRVSQQERIQKALPEGLKVEQMPIHVAVILDGNRRWAKEKGMAVWNGHISSQNALLNLIFLSSKWGIKVLSLFAFSTENWTRPQEEVDFLMGMFGDMMKNYKNDFVMYNYRVSFIGDRSKLASHLQTMMKSAEEKTRSSKGLHIIMAINYSGRYDMMQATRSIARKVKDGILRSDDISDNLVDDELETNCANFPNPDLLIRTSGEQRISNFMLWQLAYTELYFCEKKFPDFKEGDYVEALLSFQKRTYLAGKKSVD